MGGQACVFYGGAEFSRDLDLLILADAANLALFEAAILDLDAERIAVPPFEAQRLHAGHAVHFRCRREDVAGLRIDVMSEIRDGEPFDALWARRTVIEADGVQVELMSLPDLVIAKKTQRSKDWPMIERLVERSYFAGSASPAFWLMELRSPGLLVEAAARFPAEAALLAARRPCIEAALDGDLERTAVLLGAEEQAEKARDREYWAPLKREIERLRREARTG